MAGTTVTGLTNAGGVGVTGVVGVVGAVGVVGVVLAELEEEPPQATKTATETAISAETYILFRIYISPEIELL
jgi:hypothetical protein